jgi:hypothetical protein
VLSLNLEARRVLHSRFQPGTGVSARKSVPPRAIPPHDGADAENGVIGIESALPEHHVRAGHIMRDEDVVNRISRPFKTVFPEVGNGRSERIRTSGPCLPKAVLYQAELHSDRNGRGYKPPGCPRQAVASPALQTIL